MEINKKDFLKALEAVKPGLASKELIDQSTSFCFLKKRLVTYNDEISISYPMKALEFEGAVNATELYAFVNKVKSETFELTLKDNEILLKAGRSKAGLTIQAEITLAIDEVGEINKWKKLPKDFIKGIQFAVNACDTNASHAILNSVHINRNVLQSADNFRISNYEMSKKVPVKPFLLPAATCTQIIKMNPIDIASGDGWIHFKTDAGAIISCRVLEDDYMDISEFLELESGVEINFPDSTIDILEKAGIFSKRSKLIEEIITLKLSKKKLQIKSNSDTGWFKEEIKLNYTGDEIEFGIAPYLLKDILAQTNLATLGKGRLMFEGDNWKYVTLLR